MTNDGSILKE